MKKNFNPKNIILKNFSDFSAMAKKSSTRRSRIFADISTID
jgi:hypothetical protein